MIYTGQNVIKKFWTENSPHVAMPESQMNHSDQFFEPDQPVY